MRPVIGTNCITCKKLLGYDGPVTENEDHRRTKRMYTYIGAKLLFRMLVFKIRRSATPQHASLLSHCTSCCRGACIFCRSPNAAAAIPVPLMAAAACRLFAAATAEPLLPLLQVQFDKVS